VWMALGVAVSIVIGQQLGANEFDKAKQSVWRIMAFSVASAVAMGLLMCVLAPLFPAIYNTTDEVRSMATGLIRIVGLTGLLHAFNHTAYFTLRSGGKTWITFLFDGGYLWVVTIPLVRLLAIHTTLPVLLVYFLCEFVDVVKVTMGLILIKKGIWINNIVADAK